MGGLIHFILTGIGAVLLFALGHSWLGGIASGVFAIQFWTWGIMYNCSHQLHVEYARNFRQNSAASGIDVNETERILAKQLASMLPQHDAIPAGLSAVNMIASLTGIGLLVVGVIFWWK